MQDFIPVNEPYFSGNEKKYLNECIETGWVSSDGPFVKNFEDKFARYINRKYAISVCNGTAAIDVTIAALNIRPGDEIILPTFTIISCIAQIIRSGAVPILVDCEKDTWNLDAVQVLKKISKKTKAIIIPHIYGLPADLDPILFESKKRGILIIEDCAEAIGQTYNGKMCGSFGDISTFSFYANKLITTGEGGMILTDDEEMMKRIKNLRNLYMNEERRFIHEELGWNLRLSNLQAAVGLAQLEMIDKHIEIKRYIGDYYSKNLSDINCLLLPRAETSFAKNIYWVFGIVIKKNVAIDAQFVIDKLREFQIGSRPFFWPLHLQPVFLRQNLFNGESYPNSEYIAQRGFYLPSGLGVKKQQMDRVIDRIRHIFSKF